MSVYSAFTRICSVSAVLGLMATNLSGDSALAGPMPSTQTAKAELTVRIGGTEISPERIRDLSFLMFVPSSHAATEESVGYGARITDKAAQPFLPSTGEESGGPTLQDMTPLLDSGRFRSLGLARDGLDRGFAIFQEPETEKYFAWLVRDRQGVGHTPLQRTQTSEGPLSQRLGSLSGKTGALFPLEFRWVSHSEGAAAGSDSPVSPI